MVPVIQDGFTDAKVEFLGDMHGALLRSLKGRRRCPKKLALLASAVNLAILIDPLGR
jgi:hypothetical protein